MKKPLKVYRMTDPRNYDEIVAYSYDKDIAKTFCLMNDMQWEKIKEDIAINDPNFCDLFLAEICGIPIPSYLMRDLKNNLYNVVYPLKVAEGALRSTLKNCNTDEEMDALTISIDLIKDQQTKVLQSTLDDIDYRKLRNKHKDDKELELDWLLSDTKISWL